MATDPRRIDGPVRVAEGVAMAMACLAPWAFGAVEAWAEFALDLGVLAIACLLLLSGSRYRSCVPGLAIAGLALLAMAQSIAMPERLLHLLAPASASLRVELLPRSPESVAGDESGPVALPPATLSREPEASANSAARLVAAWILFQAVLSMGGGPHSLRRFGTMLVANATVLALFAVIQALTWDGKIYWFRASPQTYGWFTGGPFVSHNHLAAYLNLGLGFALAFLLPTGPRGAEGRGSVRRLWAGYAAAVLIAGIVASHSRSGFLAMVASLLLLGPVALFRSRGGLRFAAGMAGMGALVASLLIVAGNASVLSRLGSILDSASYLDRLAIWSGSIRAWSSTPVWGAGLGTFPVATAPFFDRDLDVVFMRAENEYLDILVEGGLIGLGLFLLLAFSVVRLGLRALRSASSPGERSLVLGALFGVSTLAVQSLADFCLHIPGVSVAAVILAGHLCGLGLDAKARAADGPLGEAAPRGPGRRLAAFAWPTSAVLALLVAGHGLRLARAEASLAGTDIPLTGSAPRTDLAAGEADEATQEGLGRRRAGLEAALRLRPDWAEGHLRLGLTQLEQYRLAASDWIAEDQPDRRAVALMADPLWLHGVVHDPDGGEAPTADSLLEHDPIRRHLVPAARCFLEARRCAFTLAMTHSRLAGLDYLLVGGDSSSAYGRRALAMAGAQGHVLAVVARLAAQGGDDDLAVRCWRRWLVVDESTWEEVADAAGLILPPEVILERVLPPGGRLAFRFADRLYAAPEHRESRERFLRESLRRLPADNLDDAERIHLEAEIRMRLGEQEPAIRRMEAALALAPDHIDWRKTLINWLVERGEMEAARRQALLGLHLGPEDPELRRAIERTTDALARGEGTGARPRPREP